DVVDVRLFHLAEELAGISRQRFDITPLALGVDRVKGKRALPRPGQAGDHDQLIAGNSDVYVFEVMFAGAADDDGVERHFVLWNPVAALAAVFFKKGNDLSGPYSKPPGKMEQWC